MGIENNSEFLIYQTDDGQAKIDVRMENESVWLSLNQMAELFQRDKSVISRHIKNIFSEGELDEKSVVAFFATTAVANEEFKKFTVRTKNELSPVEKHFIESIDSTAKKLKESRMKH